MLKPWEKNCVTDYQCLSTQTATSELFFFVSVSILHFDPHAITTNGEKTFRPKFHSHKILKFSFEILLPLNQILFKILPP